MSEMHCIYSGGGLCKTSGKIVCRGPTSVWHGGATGFYPSPPLPLILQMRYLCGLSHVISSFLGHLVMLEMAINMKTRIIIDRLSINL